MLAAIALATLGLLGAAAAFDWRKLDQGALMLQDAYLDQPYCVIWNASRWVCCIAANSGGTEGKVGEHTEILYSDDHGTSWTTGIRLEPESAPTNSYGVIGQTDYGRLFVVYNFNRDNVTHLPGSNTTLPRDDELGFFYWKYSDDGGETWSTDRYLVPLRNTAIDANNSFGGAVQMMWSVDQVKSRAGRADDDGRTYHAYTKIGTYMQSAPEESFFVSSPNMRTERNASAVTWDLFPEGDHGARPPIAAEAYLQWEEAHVVLLRDSPGLFAWARTDAGYLGASSTPDPTGATGWGPGHFMSYSSINLPAAAGRPVKNPEGPTTMKYVDTLGCYLMLYYNNGYPGYSPTNTSFGSRNPYWLAAGWEDAATGEVVLSQPEVVLYDAVLWHTMPGYPDFIIDGPAVWITETNKSHARVHAIGADMLTALAGQRSVNATAQGNLTYAFTPASQGQTFAAPRLPNPATADSLPGAGLTVGLWLTQHAAACPGTRTAPCALIDIAPGYSLAVDPTTLAITLTVSGPTGDYPPAASAPNAAAAAGSAAPPSLINVSVTTDPECTARLLSNAGGAATAYGAAHYFAAIFDAAAHVLTLSVDGVVCDGGAYSPWGWAHVPATLGDTGANAPPSFTLGAGYGGAILGGHVYERFLYNSEVVGNFRAGPPPS